MAAAGQGTQTGLVANLPYPTIGARVRAKNEGIRSDVERDLGVSGTRDVVDTIDQSLIVAGFEKLDSKDLEGGTRMKGGSKIGDAIKRISKNILGRLNKAKERTEQDVVNALEVIEVSGNALADASSKLGRFSVMAVATGAAVAGLNAAPEYLPGPSWQQLGLGIAAFIKAVAFDLPLAGLSATAKNPVIAIAFGTAFMKYRAQRLGMTVQDLIKQDASLIAKGVTGQMQAFQEGREEEERSRWLQKTAALGEAAKQVGTLGYPTGSLRVVAPDTRKTQERELEKLTGESTPSTVSDAKLLVEVAEAMRSAPARRTRAASSQRGPVVGPPAPSTTTGGRRKTKRGKKVKRRVTQRFVKFAY